MDFRIIKVLLPFKIRYQIGYLDIFKWKKVKKMHLFGNLQIILQIFIFKISESFLLQAHSLENEFKNSKRRNQMRMFIWKKANLLKIIPPLFPASV